MSRKATLCKPKQPKSKCKICRNEYMKIYMKRYYSENESYRNNARKKLTENDKDRLYRIQQDVIYIFKHYVFVHVFVNEIVHCYGMIHFHCNNVSYRFSYTHYGKSYTCF